MPALDIEKEDPLRGQSQRSWKIMHRAATLREQNQGLTGVLDRVLNIYVQWTCIYSGLPLLHFPNGVSTAIILCHAITH